MTAILDLLQPLQRIHHQIRNAVVNACEQSDPLQMTRVADESSGDTIYAIDRISEEILLSSLERELAPRVPFVLIAEGIHGGRIVLPRGTSEGEAAWQIIVDPIDGTRGLMYQKRSGWILTGVAPNAGINTCLDDIELAIQTEIPLVKQHLSDSVWALRGQQVTALRHNRLTGQSVELHLQPSRAPSIAHGFAMISRFFPGAREELAAIDEELVLGALGPVQPGKAHCFEDQYICSGGQLYELMAGRDRFVADLRPFMEQILTRRGLALGICCHPYDLCTELIARELGVIITDVAGGQLRSPLGVDADVAWAGYANDDIRRQMEPLLQGALRRRDLLP